MDAVTFDFWNTVMWEEPGSLRARRLELWDKALTEAGAPVDPVALASAHDAAHEAYERSWERGEQFRVDQATALIIGAIDRDMSEDVEQALLEGFLEAGRRAAVHPTDGVEECLTRLRRAEVSLGIVCDIGLTPSSVVRELLDRHGLLKLFSATTFSDEVGHYKPARAIFEHALGQLGEIGPERAAHVGDRRRTDVAGAVAFGMTAVRYNGVYEDLAVELPEADMVVADMAELPAVLGIAVDRE